MILVSRNNLLYGKKLPVVRDSWKYCHLGVAPVSGLNLPLKFTAVVFCEVHHREDMAIWQVGPKIPELLVLPGSNTKMQSEWPNLILQFFHKTQQGTLK